MRASTSATLAPEGTVNASIGIAVSRLKASFISLIILIVRPKIAAVHSITKEEPPDSLKHRFVKAAVKVLAADELGQSSRVPDKRPQHPGDFVTNANQAQVRPDHPITKEGRSRAQEGIQRISVQGGA